MNGTDLFAGDAWFDPIEAGIREVRRAARGRTTSGAMLDHGLAGLMRGNTKSEVRTVDLPEPDSPTRPTISPRRISSPNLASLANR